MTTTKLLDCGHPPTPNSGCGTGYATTGDGRQLCHPCADESERTAMARSNRIGAYISSNSLHVTTFSGGVLMNAFLMTKWAGWFDSDIYAWRAVDEHGGRWHGRNAGPGMCITMHRANNGRAAR